MILRVLILLGLAVILSSCKKAEDEAAAAHRESVVDLLSRGKYWSYRTSDVFADGGSVILGFINHNGEIVYVWFDYSIDGAENDYRRCFLQTSYNDTDAVEILRGSELESQVIELIKDANSHEVIDRYLPSRVKAVEILKSRDMNLRLLGKAVSVPPGLGAVPVPDIEVPDPSKDGFE